MKLTDVIYVAGHRGMVGSALVRLLQARGFNNLLLQTRAELDLCDTRAVNAFYQKHRPDYVFIAAARVGGIWANNTHPVEFLSENLQIELNLINGAYAAGVKKALFLGSSCIYPKLAPQPMTEDVLLTGSLEPTNEAYALAKICGIRLCQAYARQHGANFISAQPTNLYGPEDNFDLETSHVLPALIHKFHLAREKSQMSVVLWGTGQAYREFLHVDDLAEACLFLMENYNSPE
jgi:GDP-L-fucose synthase